MATGTGCTVTSAVSAWFVSSIAWMRATPRAVPAMTLPEVSSGTRARVVSRERQAIGVPAIGFPALSRAVAVSWTESRKKRDAVLVPIFTLRALEPTPTYLIGTGMPVPVPDTPSDTVTGSGPPRKTVSPAASVIARFSDSVSEDPLMGTSNESTRLSAPGGKSTVVSSAVPPVLVRVIRTLLMDSTSVAWVSKTGASESRAGTPCRGPVLSPRQPATPRATATAARRISEGRSIRPGESAPGTGRPQMTYVTIRVNCGVRS